MENVVALCLGIGLSAAVGLRVFVPPFLIGLAGAAGILDLPASAEWLSSPVALTAFGIAMAIEVLAYMVPWMDQLLDTVAGPLAVLAGIGLTASFLGELPPALQWTLALVAGGGASATTQGLSSVTRATSTVTTGGMANPVVSAVETVASVVTTILSALVPVLTALIVLGAAVFVIARLGPGRRPRRTVPGSGG